MRGWGKRVSAKLLGVEKGTQMTPLLVDLPALHLETLGPSEATPEDLHFPHFGTGPKSARRRYVEFSGILRRWDPWRFEGNQKRIKMGH